MLFAIAASSVVENHLMLGVDNFPDLARLCSLEVAQKDEVCCQLWQDVGLHLIECLSGDL